MIKKLIVVLLFLFTIFLLASCGDGKNTVVTNIQDNHEVEGFNEQADVVIDEDSYEGHNDPVQGEIKKEGTPAYKNPKESKSSEDIESPDHVDSGDEENIVVTNIQDKNTQNENTQDKNTQNENTQDKNEVKGLNEQADVVIDKDSYEGYNGPVQGEIKYQEGTPASENSKEYKSSGDIESPYNVNLIVTQDFGHTKMFGKNVGLVKDEVGMEVMFRNLDITTAYGGGFVNAINGLESQFTFYTGSERKKLDWFYWVNGILAPVGIAQYRPQQGDVIWWDYHNWGTTMFIPAVIGSYPQPFKNGFWGKNPGTVIMYTKSFEKGAEKLKQSLLDYGVKEINVIAYDPSVLEDQKKYLILLGPWEELSSDSEYLEKINYKSSMNGIFIEFKDGKLNALNYRGETEKTYDQAGAIYAHSSGMGSIKPLWFVTGTDEDSAQMALDVLLNRPSEITQYFGAVISKNGIENVPCLH